MVTCGRDNRGVCFGVAGIAQLFSRPYLEVPKVLECS